MRNAGLEEAQVGIKISGRNIDNLRYSDYTTLMAGIEEELKSLLMKVKVDINGKCRNMHTQITVVPSNTFIISPFNENISLIYGQSNIYSLHNELEKPRIN